SPHLELSDSAGRERGDFLALKGQTAGANGIVLAPMRLPPPELWEPGKDRCDPSCLIFGEQLRRWPSCKLFFHCVCALKKKKGHQTEWPTLLKPPVRTIGNF